MSQTTFYPCNLCKRFVGATFATLQLHQIRGGCMLQFIQEHGAGELSLQNSTIEITPYDDEVNDADINIDVEVGMESMSNVSVGSVASSLDDSAVVYEYIGSSLQLSAVEKAAVELTRLADQHGVNRQCSQW
ncbi:hypothetical protein G6F29_013834 [Rhizopus arrhizus]|nr:hypothetical protein G6F30_013827 [Rhizopus arrhizus]KAG0971889.1 hypothetical protein G6F29_013834 [Rhizopus arrhizus]KAG0972925.1 hypothetical protein G6F28_013799 [Rhizopus arrhizus]KAG0999999.1 hypothetical protein G6F27_013783 [Rhizopus arrhizus]KAG1007666.1 hypothetical protein G6F26_013781 [Rhizopus arrhizus]